VNGILAEDVAFVVVDVNGQAVSFRLVPQRATENVVFIERITARILFADKAFRLVFLQDAFHLLTPH
jgi:hypothetical protein